MEGLPREALFLGLEISTQSLKATAVDCELRVAGAAVVSFDADLPHYGTCNGVRRDTREAGRVTAPPLMWAEALDLALARLRNAGLPLERVRAVSGSGQQHGSVYWGEGARERLRGLDPAMPLAAQLAGAFAVEDSPVWMDSSTTRQCREIEGAVGGALAMSRLTGSRAFERFTGPQIRKLSLASSDAYRDTERISLVSSFGASLLLGDYAPIDHSDGAGMNLMDLRRRDWSSACLQATAPQLLEKLGPLVPSHSVAGTLHNYYVQRFGFSLDCSVVAWSGDNPCSLAGQTDAMPKGLTCGTGLALDKPGDLAISLGTSDTVFGVVADPQPSLNAHVFPNPVDPCSYMAMLCYKNGSLARQEVRDRCARSTWHEFDSMLQQTPPLNDGNVGFFYHDVEILPPLPIGIHRFKTQGKDYSALPQAVTSFEPPTEVRAIAEGQMLSMRGHAEGIGMPIPPERVIATGGGSASSQLLQIAADVFHCNVFTAERPDSACLGAALRAAQGWLCARDQQFVPFSEVIQHAGDKSAIEVTMAAQAGSVDLHETYGRLCTARLRLERQLLQENNPSALEEASFPSEVLQQSGA